MHQPQMTAGSVIPNGYKQVQGDLETALCECGDTLYRGLRGGWRHWSNPSTRPESSGDQR